MSSTSTAVFNAYIPNHVIDDTQETIHYHINYDTHKTIPNHMRYNKCETILDYIDRMIIFLIRFYPDMS